MLVRRKGRAAWNNGPRGAAVLTDLSPVRFSVHSSFPVTRVEVSEVATPNPAEIKSPGVLAAQGPPRGLFPFLSLRITEAQMTDMN